MTFLGFQLECWLPDFLGAFDSSALLIESPHVSNSISEIRIIQLMTEATFQELAQNQLTTQAGSQYIDSDRLMAQAASLGIKSNWFMTLNASPLFDSNRLMTQAKKNIWIWVESYPCLSHTHVCWSLQYWAYRKYTWLSTFVVMFDALSNAFPFLANTLRSRDRRDSLEPPQHLGKIQSPIRARVSSFWKKKLSPWSDGQRMNRLHMIVIIIGATRPAIVGMVFIIWDAWAVGTLKAAPR